MRPSDLVLRPSKMVRAVESTALAAERDQLFCVVGDSCQCTERFGCCASHHDDYEAVDRIEDDVNERTAAEECSRTHHAKHGGVAVQEYCGDQGEQCSADTDEHTRPFPESLDEVREYGNGDEIVMRCRSCIYFSRRFHQIWKPSQETKAITSQTRINAAIIRPPPYRNRSLLMAITSSMMGVSRLRIARIAYSQRKGSRKNLPVSIYLSTGSKNEEN